ncbi:MAG: LuxR C-terminal-related transcriptional regulator, partial [Planctomycetaceae bacterium]
CGEAAGPAEALQAIDRLQPDLVLVDLSLKGGHGIELIGNVKKRHPQIRMLVLSGFPEALYAERSLRAGADGYLNKQESTDRLLVAIRSVLAGRRYLSSELERRLADLALGRPSEPDSTTSRLSDREMEIFRLIGQGLSTKALAESLYLSPHTIDTHRENIKRKLGLANAAELIRAAVQYVLEHG